MTQLLENTYNAYEQFLEGELNEYDLMSLIEDEIISGEVLESMLVESGLVDEELEEGIIGNIKGEYYYRKATGGLGDAHVLTANAGGIPKLDNIKSGTITDRVYNNRMRDRNDIAKTIKNFRKAYRNWGVSSNNAREIIKKSLPDYKPFLGKNHRDLLSRKRDD